MPHTQSTPHSQQALLEQTGTPASVTCAAVLRVTVLALEVIEISSPPRLRAGSSGLSWPDLAWRQDLT